MWRPLAQLVRVALAEVSTVRVLLFNLTFNCHVFLYSKIRWTFGAEGCPGTHMSKSGSVWTTAKVAAVTTSVEEQG